MGTNHPRHAIHPEVWRSYNHCAWPYGLWMNSHLLLHIRPSQTQRLNHHQVQWRKPCSWRIQTLLKTGSLLLEGYDVEGLLSGQCHCWHMAAERCSPLRRHMAATSSCVSSSSGLVLSPFLVSSRKIRSPAEAKGTAPSAVWGLCGEIIPEGSAGKGATSRDQEGTGIPLKSHRRLPRSLSL